MFDLPVVQKAERKAANDFRLALLDMGFSKSQLSVYLRFCSSAKQLETYSKRVEEALPEDGRVNIIQFTDKQYENIVSYYAGKKQRPHKKPDQYDLF